MKIPDTFQFKYMYQGKQNSYLNKVSECYLQGMDVSYGEIDIEHLKVMKKGCCR